ncbi:type IV pilus assembly protein PilC [Orenia metallireducens]|uniref:Type IV pilus assembly protein PilC n=1 Tax=Orenia metallireducens TaxID=1413210 RepID=A0A285GUK9_9FIRM|nr:type II secretion system F family protein [Orenia metallireducens]PRX31143.1 type IV pilus assembly protein PilC [Orenia metallireducens]SNY27340.1 type IV pilus assembly protein PilC [Orenia metallireducens]
MAEFIYQARSAEGNRLDGSLEADNEQMAVKRLRDKGYYIVSIEEYKDRNINFKLFSRVGLKDLVVFSRQFATMINAGISLVRALEILSTQTDNLKLREAITSIKDNVEGGMPLSAALEEKKKIFPDLFISMVAAGEAGGLLDETLEEMADHLESENELRQKIFSALAYPVVISFVSLCSVIFLIVGVLPTFVDMFNDMNVELPTITKFVLALSAFVSSYWWLILVMLAMLILGVYYYRKTGQGRRHIDRILLKLPIVGDLITKLAAARFTKTLSVLISSGVSIIESLEIVEAVMSNKVVADNISQAKQAITEGESMVLPLRQQEIFPPMLLQMINVGEETGRLDEMLLRVAGFYEQEVKAKTEGLVSLIEPLLIVILGLVVGGIMMSVMLPMFDMINGI